MNAPMRALVSLLCINAASWSYTRTPVASPLEVYLQTDRYESPELLASLRTEVDQLMKSAGYVVHWMEPQSATDGDGARSLALVKLKGVCAERQPSKVFSTASPHAWLGSTVVNEGHVSPFISVNCALLGRMLAGDLEAQPAVRHDQLMGRAAGRVIAHEIYHLLSDSTGHTSEGVTKASFDVADLLTGKLVFTDTALRQLAPPQLIARN